MHLKADRKRKIETRENSEVNLMKDFKYAHIKKRKSQNKKDDRGTFRESLKHNNTHTI